MKKIILVAGLLFALAGAARADGTITGYACKVAWWPSYAGAGDYGLVYTYVWSGSHCAGTQVGIAYFCTTGGTNANMCAPQTQSELQAATLVQNLRQAAADGQQIQISTYSTKPQAGYAVEFAFH